MKSIDNFRLIGKGLCIIESEIEGISILIENPLEAFGKCYNKIIVVDNPNPSLVLLMREAKGVISKRGGLTCHLSVLGRELGIPVIVGIGEETYNEIKNNKYLRIVTKNNEGIIYEDN